MLGKIPAARLALIEKIVRERARAGCRSPAAPLAADFRARLLPRRRGGRPAHARARGPGRGGARAPRVRPGAHGQPRAGRPRAGARGRRPGPCAHRAVVRVVAPDMPFLVESIGIVFSEMNIARASHRASGTRRAARCARHADALCGADSSAAPAESWQLMEIDRPRDETQARELLRRLHRALEDVRKAVSDFRACSNACAPWPTISSARRCRCRNPTRPRRVRC